MSKILRVRESLAVGTRLGPYEIVSALGAGGMGEVYRAPDVKLGRDVAIKVMPPAFLTDPDACRDSSAKRKFLRRAD
jgi:serine/threonine protein kinase